MYKTGLMAAGGAALVGAYLLSRKTAPVAGQAGTSASTTLTPPKVGQPSATPKPAVPSPLPVAMPTSSARATLITRVEAAIKKEIPVRPTTETAASIHALAVHLVDVCASESYPLDLAFGHAYAESNLALNAVNTSSGARGPLQVTAIAAAEVRMVWPLSEEGKVRAGVKYMKHLRAAYPADCGRSVRATLQTYGMGRGNWLKFRVEGCSGKPCERSVSVWRAECGCDRPYSALIIAVAKRHPELQTVEWWGA